MRWAPLCHLAAALLLASCAHPPAKTSAEACRLDPDGAAPRSTAPLSTDRGIGGTGAPALADKGIGGTGINRTGLAGVITGFASICAGGLEIAFTATTPISADESAIPANPLRANSIPANSLRADSLRAGQVVVATATSSNGTLHAIQLQLRHEVSGPINRLEAQGRRLIVAGQAIDLPDRLWGITHPQPGDWVQISGIRPTPTSPVLATRIDRAQPGQILIHGLLTQTHAKRHIGELTLPDAESPMPTPQPATQQITLKAHLIGATLHVDSITPDLMQIDPGAYFGPDIGQIVLETYVQQAATGIRLSSGFTAATAPGLALPAPNRLSLVELRREPSGALKAVSVRDSASHGPTEQSGRGAPPEPRGPGAPQGTPRGGQSAPPNPAGPMDAAPAPGGPPGAANAANAAAPGNAGPAGNAGAAGAAGNTGGAGASGGPGNGETGQGGQGRR